MGAYLVRRLLLVIPAIVLITMAVFLAQRFIPGSVIDTLASQSLGTIGSGVDRAELEHRLGLDAPMYVQYFRWVGGMLHGDLGTSLLGSLNVTDIITRRFPVTFELGILAILISLIGGIPIGIYSAVRQNSMGDYIGRTFAIICIAIPGFWVGLLVVIYPAIWWNWSPSIEYIPITKNFGQNIIQFIIPAAILGMSSLGVTMRMTRTMMLEVLKQDYIRTAWAKGLKERVVVIRHGLRNALIPVVTLIGLYIPVIVGGSVILEQLFTLPGLGRSVFEALNARDYPIVSGINLVIALFVVLTNLVIDMTYSYIDPRIRYK